MFTPENMSIWAISYIISLGANLTTEVGKKFIDLFKDQPEISAKLEDLTPDNFKGTPKARLQVAFDEAFTQDASLLRNVSTFAQNIEGTQILTQEGSKNIGLQERAGADGSQIMNQKGDNNYGRQSSS